MTANDVGVGGDYVWLVSNEEVPGGFKVYWADYPSNNGRPNWKTLDEDTTGLVRIDADTKGGAYGIDENLQVHYLHKNGTAKKVDDLKAIELAVSPLDVLWTTATDFRQGDGGSRIYQHRDGRDGDKAGAAKYAARRMMSLSVGGEGVIWGVGAGGTPWRGDTGAMSYYYEWKKIDSAGGIDIDVGANGDVWKVDNTGQVKERSGSGWVNRGKPAASKAVAIDVSPWGDGVVALENGELHHYKSGTSWQKISSPVGAIDIGLTDEHMYIVSNVHKSGNSKEVHVAPYNENMYKRSHGVFETDQTKTAKFKIDAGYRDGKGTLVGIYADGTPQANFDRDGWTDFINRRNLIDVSVWSGNSMDEMFWGVGGGSERQPYYLITKGVFNAPGIRGVSGVWKMDETLREVSGNAKTTRISNGPLGEVWVLTENNRTYRRLRIDYH